MISPCTLIAETAAERVGILITDENKEIVRQYREQVLGKLDADAVDTFVTDDFVQHGPGRTIVQGPEGIKASIATAQMMRGAFVDDVPRQAGPQLATQTFIADGDMVAVLTVRSDCIEFIAEQHNVEDLERMEGNEASQRTRPVSRSE